jgi:hypothetical protein
MCRNHWAIEKNGELLITTFNLQVTSYGGRTPEDADLFLRESRAYWDQALAGAELQVALDKMSWPTYCEDILMSPPRKILKT